MDLAYSLIMEPASHLSFEQRAADNRRYGFFETNETKTSDSTNNKIKEEAGTVG